MPFTKSKCYFHSMYSLYFRISRLLSWYIQFRCIYYLFSGCLEARLGLLWTRKLSQFFSLLVDLLDITKVYETFQLLISSKNKLPVNEVIFPSFRKILVNGDQLHFTVREIRRLDFCTQEKCNNGTFFLNEFGRTIQDTSDPVCLAHLFTYRDFPNGKQGNNELT